MGQFVEGIKSLFTGPDTSAQKKQADEQRDAQSIALTRSEQTLQNSDAEQSKQAGLASRQPRGRRLLLAATGEGGVSSRLG